MRRLLDIGNCVPDHSAITSLVTANFDAQVDQAHRLEDAATLLGQHEYSLVLVNRLLDCDGSSGLDVIRSLKAEWPDVPIMMITNF